MSLSIARVIADLCVNGGRAVSTTEVCAGPPDESR